MADDPSTRPSLTSAFDRITNLVELMTTLDRRVLAALDGIEDMSARLAAFEELSATGDDLVADLQKRVAALDQRLNRDLDELKSVLMAKLGELDLGQMPTRIDRLEAAVFNIERATVRLDRNFESTVEALPDFVVSRIRKEQGPNSAPPADPTL